MPLKVILAGLGTRGKYWAEVVKRSADCDLLGYVDPSPAALEQACLSFGERPSFASLKAALEQLESVEAIILSTPPEGRAEQIQLACDHHLPLLVEKPLALDLQTAAHYVQMAEDAGIALMVGLNFRYLSVTKAVEQLLAEGKVGKPEFARFTYERWRDGKRPNLNKYPLTMAQPMLWEQSIHHFDLLRHVYQKEPLSVYAQTWNPSWSMYADDANVSALFHFEDGLKVNYQGTWQSAHQEPHFEWRTDCSEGVIIQLEQFGDLFYARRHEATLTPVALPPHEIWVSETARLLAAFVATVVQGQPLECSGRDHLKSLAMIKACILSSHEHRLIELAPILHDPLSSMT